MTNRWIHAWKAPRSMAAKMTITKLTTGVTEDSVQKPTQVGVVLHVIFEDPFISSGGVGVGVGWGSPFDGVGDEGVSFSDGVGWGSPFDGAGDGGISLTQHVQSR